MSRVHYNEEMKLQTIKLVLKGEKSATKLAKEIGVTANTVCRWVQDYRKKNNLPSYEEEYRLKKVSIEELATKNRELERKLKQREKELAEERETVEILKKSMSRISRRLQASLQIDMIEAIGFLEIPAHL
ncbi:Transposase [Fibrobacter sp. UWH9]|uniref:helix-turn-helix domain-containing protein n=1 Tax=Fibrobacter sp. UWH9 TaxID=1896213 RepID=UPI000914A11E|nr:helix-turn-helix domain-containing protein [Fibrobacter sp. UWH9]SHG48090.1 Transposase [Fibrobacter sp. UWH9]